MEKPRSVSVSRQASARPTTSSISCSVRVRWRRTRQEAPVRRTRFTACRVTRISRPPRSKEATGRIASSPSWRAPSPARAKAFAPSSEAPMTAGAQACRMGGVQPGGDGVRPGLAVADGVAAGEADTGLDAVGDGGLAAG